MAGTLNWGGLSALFFVLIIARFAEIAGQGATDRGQQPEAKEPDGIAADARQVGETSDHAEFDRVEDGEKYDGSQARREKRRPHD